MPNNSGMPKIDIVKRNAAVCMIQSGSSQREVSRDLNISRGAVEGIWKKYLLFGKVDNVSKCGRPRKSSDREERLLVIMSKKEPKLTAPKLRFLWKTKCTVSVSTTQRILRKYGLFGRSAAKRPLLNKKQRRNRLSWCRAYSKLDNKFWESVIYSDECRMELHSNKKQIVRRPINTRFNPRYTTKTMKHGYKSLMLWGAIRYDGHRMLTKCPNMLNSTEYQLILERALIPLYDSSNVFQHDGAPCHRSKSTMDYIDKSKICHISDWPAQSPDLNIIESLWSILKRNVSEYTCNTVEDLWSACQHEWSSISDETIKKLYRSIPKRLNEVIRQKGSNTSY